jgi:polysaccharide pyruvyl transferase CsaB
VSGPDGEPRRLFLVGYSGVHNVGDEAIRAAIVAAAPSFGAEVVHLASRDDADPDPRAVPVHGLGLWRYVRAIGRCDRVVLGGGGILKDEGLRLPLELFATALAARLLRRDVTLVAVGVGPFYTRLGGWLARVTARLARVRTVRDADSLEALNRLGVRRVVLGADPTFSLSSEASGGRAPRDPASAHGVIAVSLRRWYRGAPDGDARQTALREGVAAALAGPIVEGRVARLLSCYWPRDLDEMQRLGIDERLGDAELIEHELDWTDLTAAVGDADLVVAMRYHAVAAAAMAGRPIVALAYEPKVKALATELGVPTVDVDLPDAELAATIRIAVDRALADPDSARPDPVALAALRDRSALALRLALGPRVV